MLEVMSDKRIQDLKIKLIFKVSFMIINRIYFENRRIKYFRLCNFESDFIPEEEVRNYF